MTDLFADYASAMARHFGDRVKHWMTINEPVCIADGHVPGLKDGATLAAVGHHLLLGHGKALRAIKAVAGEHHQVGLVCNLYPIQAFGRHEQVDSASRSTAGDSVRGTPNRADAVAEGDAPLTDENLAEAVRRADGKINRMFLDPLYRGYPSPANPAPARGPEIPSGHPP